MADSVLNIRLNSTGDWSALTAARSQADALGASLSSVKAIASTLGASVSIMGFASLAKSALTLGANIVDMSARLQMSTDAFQIMGEVARKAGLDTETMTTILGRLRGVIDTAAESGGKAELAFEALGLNAKILADVPLEAALIAIATQVNTATDRTKAYAAAVEILGAKNLPKLNEVLLSLAHGGYAEAAKSAEILAREQAIALKEAEVTWLNFGHTVEIVSARAMNAIERLVEKYRDLKLGNSGPKSDVLPPGVITLAPASAQDLADTDNSPAALAARSATLTDQENMAEALANETKLEYEHAKNVAAEWDKIEKSNAAVLKLTEEINDPFYEMEVKAQRIADAMQAGTISMEDGKQALATLGGEMWDKGMGLAGFPENVGAGGGGRGKQTTGFEAIKEKFDNSGSMNTDMNPDAMSASQGAEAALMQFGSKAGTIGQQVQGVFSTAFSSIESNLSKVIMGTETWKQALGSIVASIEGSLVSAFIAMGTKWIATHIMMAVEGRAIAAAGAAAMIPMAMAESEIWAAPAALATIASWGGAAVAAPELVLASMASTQALAGFSEGGFTGDSGGIVHGGEFVWSAPAVKNIGVENLTRAHEMAMNPAAAAASGGGAGEMSQSFHMHADYNAAFRAAMKDPANKRTILDTHRMAARHV